MASIRPQPLFGLHTQRERERERERESEASVPTISPKRDGEKSPTLVFAYAMIHYSRGPRPPQAAAFLDDVGTGPEHPDDPCRQRWAGPRVGGEEEFPPPGLPAPFPFPGAREKKV